MRKILTFLLLSIFLISLASAEIQFFQKKSDIGNGTIQNHLTTYYSKGGFGVTDDYVSGNNPYEVYLLYNVYPNKWNIDNPNYRVNYCEIKVWFWGKMENTSSLVFNQNYTPNDADIFNARYFMKLTDGDGMIADQICYFQNKSYSELYLPAEFQLVTPTWECKECQYYEWLVQEKDISKAKVVGDNIVSVSSYIKKLILLNFEIMLALFWIFLIIMVFVAIGLIFMMAYWFYLFIKRMAK